MGNVNANLETILKSAQNLKNALDSISKTKSYLSSTYQKLGVGWNDKKYKELGDIIVNSNKALSNLAKILQQVEKYTAALVKSLEEYESTNFDSTKGLGFGSYIKNLVSRNKNTTSASIINRLANVGIYNVNLAGIPTNVQNDIASSFEKMATLFPESIGIITSISISKNMGDSTPASTGYSTQNGILQTSMNINPTWFAADNLDTMISECTENGSWAGNGIGGIINHEIAHAMHLQLDAEELGMQVGTNSGISYTNCSELSNRWCNNTTTNNIRDTVLDNMSLTRDDIYDSVSQYADVDGSECFAECVADYSTSSSPNPISINIVNEYRRRLSTIRHGGN